MNLVKLGDERLQRLGDTRTFVFEGDKFSASQINEMGRRLANGLKSIGIGRGDHVVVSLSNSPEVFACFAAIWRLGAVIVPIMFLLGEDETRYILDHSDAKAVITSADLMEKIQNAAEGIDRIQHIIVLGGADRGNQVDFYGLVENNPPLQETAEMDPDDVALMIYTSGTTGRPKGCRPCIKFWLAIPRATNSIPALWNAAPSVRRRLPQNSTAHLPPSSTARCTKLMV